MKEQVLIDHDDHVQSYDETPEDYAPKVCGFCNTNHKNESDDEMCKECEQEQSINQKKGETKMKKNTEVAEVPEGSNSPAEMIAKAIAGGADLGQMEKFLNIQERWEANEAKKAYHKAMAEFKAVPIKITKDKKVGYNTKGSSVGYSHASLANVVSTITAELSKHGLSASWNTKQNGAITVSCRITHTLGHTEETTLTAGADSTGSKNSIQAIGSTITYLQRYTLLAALGLAAHDQDDDGRASVRTIENDQLNVLRDLLISLGMEKKEGKFVEFLGVDKLENLPISKFQQAVTMLEAKKEKVKK